MVRQTGRGYHQFLHPTATFCFRFAPAATLCLPALLQGQSEGVLRIHTVRNRNEAYR